MKLAIPVMALLAGCTLDRVEDSAALRDSYKQLQAMPHCEHPIEVVDAELTTLRAHRTIASLSATCSPGSPRVCKQSLLERACELKADALIIEDRPPSGGPWQGSDHTLKPMSARALLWTD
jgi:hypothetical protein